MGVKVTIHGLGKGTCALSGEQADGLTVTMFGMKEVFLSHKSFLQFVQMKLGKDAAPKPNVPPRVAAAAANGQA